MLDYSKYENATQKQIMRALNVCEKRVQKLNGQLKENKELSKFLQKKLKNEQKRIKELDEAIRDYENGNVVVCKTMEEFKAKMAQD